MMIDTKETTEGRRIEARSFADGQVDAVRRYWYNDQWQVLTQGLWSQAYASFTLSRNYLYGNTIDEVLGFEWVVDGTPSIWYYYLHDHLYSPAAMLTEYGVVERYEYDAYGWRSVMTPGFAHRNNSHYLSDIGLTGREIDELDRDAAATPRLQHMHYRHRDYSPQLGRFMQQDPLGIVPRYDTLDYYISPKRQYTDGINLYNGYFAMHMKLDPMGTAMSLSDLAKKALKGMWGVRLSVCTSCYLGTQGIKAMCEVAGRICGEDFDKKDCLCEVIEDNTAWKIACNACLAPLSAVYDVIKGMGCED